MDREHNDLFLYSIFQSLYTLFVKFWLNHVEYQSCELYCSRALVIDADTLKTNLNLERLILNKSDIGDIGFQSLLSSLSNLLFQFKVTNSLISAKSLPYLLEFIKTHRLLREFSLENNAITIHSAPELNFADLIDQIVNILNRNHCICELEINTKIKDIIEESTNSDINLSDSIVRGYYLLLQMK
ncbi:hypothetical protein I4U23_005664 [Adineta vaga]|nr:hypothetical protein I4U23_005664 [Adineta vaga]